MGKEGSRETSQEATAATQARDDGSSDEGGHNGSSKLVEKFWENIKGKTTIFPDGYKRKRSYE